MGCRPIRVDNRVPENREGEIKVYRYYSTERPVSLGTYPKTRGNMPINIKNFEKRLYVPEVKHEAYGYLEYEHELTDKQIDAYELCSKNNDVSEFASCIKAGKLKEAKEPWHKYLKGKTLLLFDLFGRYSLTGILYGKYKSEKLESLCKYVWENCKEEMEEEGYEKVEDFIEEVNLGNDGFAFDKDEIELLDIGKIKGEISSMKNKKG